MMSNSTDSAAAAPTADPVAARRLHDALSAMPLIAILRGIRPDEAVGIGQALQSAGFRVIEVPLNSPEPLESIRCMSAALPDCVIGAGTVTQVEQIAPIGQAGGQLIVMPHADTAVIRAAKAAGFSCMPGVATPTEAFAAIAAGADGLKLFPAEMLGPAVVRALRAVLPRELRVAPVGSITPDNLGEYRAAGANAFGLGGALYRPGHSAADVARNAAAFVEAVRRTA